MTALSRPSVSPDSRVARSRAFLLRAGVGVFQGSLMGSRVGSQLVEPITSRPDLIPRGWASENTPAQATSTTSIHLNTAGFRGGLQMGTGADAFTLADTGRAIAYGIDDNTVGKTDGGGTRSPVGIFDGFTESFNADSLVRISMRDPDPLLAGLGSGLLAAATDGFEARGVVYNNQADLAAFAVTSDDGVTYVADDVVALVGQTTGAQNGLYVVGAVALGVAQLTRHPLMAAGALMPNGFTFNVGVGGTFYGGSTWKALSTQTGGWLVGTHDPLFYPKNYKQLVTLAAGVYTIGVGSTATPDEPLFLASGADVQITRDTANTSTATTGGYAAPAASRITGKAGTAALLVRAETAAGALNNADLSTLRVLGTNW